MASFNKVMLIGNLTRDPELRYTPSGTAVTEFGLAVNRSYKSVSGERREDVCFVDITVFGRKAEVANEYLSKGQPLFIEGRLQYDTWETNDGQRRSKHRVVAENFEFLARRGDTERRERKESKPPISDDDIGAADVGKSGEDDDIPF